MGKNILILSGSPRKGGNSDTLCDQFIKGAENSGCLPDSTVKGVILGAGAWKLGDIQGNDVMPIAYEMGKEV